MTLAIVTSNSLAAGYNQASLAAFIDSELLALGFTQVFSDTTTNVIRVYKYQVNTATYGTIYLRTQINPSGYAVTFGIAPTYNNSTGDLINGYSAPSQSYNAQINSIRVNHPEMRFINLGTLAIGYLRPATQYPWFPDTSYSFFFSSQYSGYMTRHSPNALSPMGNSAYAMPSPAIVAVPPISSPQIKRAPFLLGVNPGYVWGQYSRDVASVPATAAIGNTFEDGTDVFTTVLADINIAALAVRTV